MEPQTQPTISIQNTPQASGDHDLLIQIATKMDRAISDIKDLKDNTTARVTSLEEEKVNERDFKEYRDANDTRMDALSKKLDKVYSWVLLGLGGLGVIEFGLQLYTNYFK
jgi:N12 class adenine-specific DNA methylase